MKTKTQPSKVSNLFIQLGSSQKLNRVGFFLILIAMGLIVLTACSKSTSEATSPDGNGASPSTQASSQRPYPASEENNVPESSSYPGPQSDIMSSSPYPAPDQPGMSNTGIQFKIDTPVIEGATEITGTGVAGIFLNAIDISMNGLVLGNGIVNDDNVFAIQLADPLEANRLIGIEVATQLDSQSWSDLWELRAENARSIPGMGYYFDTTLVQPK
jgi:hypothetical protein